MGIAGAVGALFATAVLWLMCRARSRMGSPALPSFFHAGRTNSASANGANEKSLRMPPLPHRVRVGKPGMKPSMKTPSRQR
jgi:hypothetical protein